MADETMWLRGESGVVREHKLPLPEGIAHRLAKGYIARVNPDGSPWVGQSEPVKPATTAPKAAWVGWAVANGADPDEADGMTKADLIDKFGK